MNGISSLVLFESRATRSFAGAMGELDCPLDIEIADDRSIRVSRVH